MASTQYIQFLQITPHYVMLAAHQSAAPPTRPAVILRLGHKQKPRPLGRAGGAFLVEVLRGSSLGSKVLKESVV
jgi:hypothetical protein